MDATKRTPLRQGIIDGAVFLPILAPFSILFGVIAGGASLTLFETLGYSLAVFAGASQLAAISLVNENAPVAIAIFAGLALNLRFLFYSATLQPHFRGLSAVRRGWMSYLLVDQNFVLSDTRFPDQPNWDAHAKSRYYFGVMIPVAVPWHIFTLIGYGTGGMIPPNIDISFALPLAFIALIMPAIKARPHLVAALISVAGALLLYKIPYNGGLLIAAAIAVCVAAEIEKRQEEAAK